MAVVAGGLNEPESQVREREDDRLGDHDEAAQRAQAPQRGRGHILK